MKNTITTLTISFLVLSTYADITKWSYRGGQLYDQDSAQIFQTNAGTYYGHVFLDYDLQPFIKNNKINITDINEAYQIADISVQPPFRGFQYWTYLYSGEDSITGSQAYLVIKEGQGAIKVGDFIGLGGNGTLVSLQSSDDPQVFNSSDVTMNIEVIPEPSSIVLMTALGGLGFIIRRRFRR